VLVQAPWRTAEARRFEWALANLTDETSAALGLWPSTSPVPAEDQGRSPRMLRAVRHFARRVSSWLWPRSTCSPRLRRP